MAFLAKLLSGGFLAGYRTYLIGFGLAAQALGLWLAGDLALSDFLARLPEILGGMGLMALRAGVDKAVKVLVALEAAGVFPAAHPEADQAGVGGGDPPKRA